MSNKGNRPDLVRRLVDAGNASAVKLTKATLMEIATQAIREGRTMQDFILESLQNEDLDASTLRMLLPGLERRNDISVPLRLRSKHLANRFSEPAEAVRAANGSQKTVLDAFEKVLEGGLRDRTVVVDRPASLVYACSDVVQAALENWRNRSDYNTYRMVELVERSDRLHVSSVGLGSLLAEAVGADAARDMKGIPAIADVPTQYEAAVYEGYERAIATAEPVLQDVHARMETDNGLVRERYRRLIVPLATEPGNTRLLVACERLAALPA